jgi:PAS domain S-box-containing protein
MKMTGEAQSGEKNIRETAKQFDETIDRLPIAVIETDLRGIITCINQIVPDVLGYTREELIGKSFYTLLPHKEADRCNAIYGEAMTGQWPTEYELTMQKKDGRQIGSLIHTKPCRSSRGKLNGLRMFLIGNIWQKGTEYPLLQADVFYIDLINSIPHPIMLVTLEKSIQYINPALEKLTGYTKAELVGLKAPFPWWPPNLVDQYMREDPPPKGSISSNIERLFINKNGEQFWVEVHINPMQQDGKITGYLSSWMDISIKKKAEQELKYQALIVDNVTDAVISTNLEHNILSWNKAAENLFGWKREEALGKTMASVIPMEMDAEAQRESQKQLVQNGHWEGELVIKGRDGRRVNLYDTASRFKNINGMPIGYVAVFHDITAQKKAEQELKYQALIVDNVTDAVISTDLEHNILSWNKAAERLLGWQKEEALGKPIMSVIPVEMDAEAALASEQQLYKHGHWDGEVIHTGRDGRGVNLHVTANWFKNNDGTPIGYVAVYHDITEQKKAEQNLRYQALLVDNIFDAVVSTDMNHNIISWNKAAEKIFGWKEEEALGKSIISLTPIEITKEQYLDSMVQLDKNGHWEGEYVYKRRDGVSLNLFSSVSWYRDSNGEPIGHVAIYHDMTEQKKAAESLQQMNAFNASILENTPNPIIVYNPDTSVRYVNPAFEKLTGFAASEILHHKAPFPYWPAEKTAEYLKENKNAVSHLREHPKIERYYQKKNGEPLWVELVPAIVPDNTGKAVYYIWIWTDMTDRKRAQDQIKLNEARLESLLRLSQYQEESEQKLLDFALEEAIKLTQSKIGYIFYFNEDKNEFTLSTCSRQVYNECEINNFPTTCPLEKAGIWGEAARQRKSVIINDFTASNSLKKGLPEGHVRLDTFMTTPVIVKNKIVAVIGVANKKAYYDQTDEMQLTLLMDAAWKIVEKSRVGKELKLILAKLQKSYSMEKEQRQELEAEAKARGMFLNILGHELRTPLTPLIASSTMLKEAWGTSADEIKTRLVENILNSANSLGERLEELLDLARFSRGTFTLKKQPVNLTALIQKTVAGYQAMADQQKKNLVLELASNFPGEMEADPARLEQVLNNLLSNAFKFSPANTTITLKAHAQENTALIEVKDQGIGMSQEEQKYLFQPYHRVEQDRKYPGFGLGLAVCKQIIEAHGGKITIQSESDKGARFIVLLPINR